MYHVRGVFSRSSSNTSDRTETSEIFLENIEFTSFTSFVGLYK